MPRDSGGLPAGARSALEEIEDHLGCADDDVARELVVGALLAVLVPCVAVGAEKREPRLDLPVERRQCAGVAGEVLHAERRAARGPLDADAGGERIEVLTPPRPCVASITQ